MCVFPSTGWFGLVFFDAWHGNIWAHGESVFFQWFFPQQWIKGIATGSRDVMQFKQWSIRRHTWRTGVLTVLLEHLKPWPFYTSMEQPIPNTEIPEKKQAGISIFQLSLPPKTRIYAKSSACSLMILLDVFGRFRLQIRRCWDAEKGRDFDNQKTTTTRRAVNNGWGRRFLMEIQKAYYEKREDKSMIKSKHESMARWQAQDYVGVSFFGW